MVTGKVEGEGGNYQMLGNYKQLKKSATGDIEFLIGGQIRHIKTTLTGDFEVKGVRKEGGQAVDIEKDLKAPGVMKIKATMGHNVDNPKTSNKVPIKIHIPNELLTKLEKHDIKRK